MKEREKDSLSVKSVGVYYVPKHTHLERESDCFICKKSELLLVWLWDIRCKTKKVMLDVCIAKLIREREVKNRRKRVYANGCEWERVRLWKRERN